MPRHADQVVEATAGIGGLDAQGRGEELQRPTRDLRPCVLLPMSTTSLSEVFAAQYLATLM